MNVGFQHLGHYGTPRLISWIPYSRVYSVAFADAVHYSRVDPGFFSKGGPKGKFSGQACMDEISRGV